MTHIVLAADSAYVHYVRCTIAQLAVHARDAEGIVVVVPPSMDALALAPVRRDAERCGFELEVVTLAEIGVLQEAGVIHRRDHVSTFTYSKILLPDALPHLDDILYLDVDTLVRSSISRLLAWDLRYPIGAVPELGRNGMHLFGTTQTPYFNAGVLRMSLRALRAEQVGDRGMEIIRTRPKLPFQDQDVLNLLFHDGFDALPLAFNVFDMVATESPHLKVFQDPAIVHFVGAHKPWHAEATSYFAQEWRLAHAEAMGMSPRDASRYAVAPAGGKGRNVARSVAAIRHSRAGRTVRGALPLSVKHAANMALLKAVPPKSRMSTDLLRGLTASSVEAAERAPTRPPPKHRAPPAPEVVPVDADALVELPPPSPVPPEDPPPRPMPDPRQSVMPRPVVARLVGARAGIPLDLMISIPRSGTNALGALLERGYPDLSWEGELFLGFVRSDTVARLQPLFPWIGSHTLDMRRQLDGPQRRAVRAEYRQRMSRDIVPVVRALASDRHDRPLVKLFPNQVDDSALAQMLQEFRPRLLVARRALIYSFVSELKASQERSYFSGDNTDSPIAFDDRSVTLYVRRADEWFARVLGLADELDLEVLKVTYSGVFETRADLPRLREFYGLLRPRDVALEDNAWIGAPTVQDRRTDASLSRTLRLFGRLNRGNQGTLLRLPGPLGEVGQ